MCAHHRMWWSCLPPHFRLHVQQLHPPPPSIQPPSIETSHQRPTHLHPAINANIHSLRYIRVLERLAAVLRCSRPLPQMQNLPLSLVILAPYAPSLLGPVISRSLHSHPPFWTWTFLLLGTYGQFTAHYGFVTS